MIDAVTSENLKSLTCNTIKNILWILIIDDQGTIHIQINPKNAWKPWRNNESINESQISIMALLSRCNDICIQLSKNYVKIFSTYNSTLRILKDKQTYISVCISRCQFQANKVVRNNLIVVTNIFSQLAPISLSVISSVNTHRCNDNLYTSSYWGSTHVWRIYTSSASNVLENNWHLRPNLMYDYHMQLFYFDLFLKRPKSNRENKSYYRAATTLQVCSF